MDIVHNPRITLAHSFHDFQTFLQVKSQLTFTNKKPQAVYFNLRMISQIKTKILQPHVQFIFINFFTSVQQLCVGFLNVSAKQKATITRAVYGHVQTTDISASKNSFSQQATVLEIPCVVGVFVGFWWPAAKSREEWGQRRENPHSSPFLSRLRHGPQNRQLRRLSWKWKMLAFLQFYLVKDLFRSLT